MDEGGDGGADQQRRGRHTDERLPLPGAPRGNRTAQMVEGAVRGLEVLYRSLQHPAQGHFVPAKTLSGSLTEAAQLIFRPVVHNFVSSPVVKRPVRPVPLKPVPVPAHAVASMATRSAAMPREPYAFTEPSDIPSVSAT